VDKLGLAGAWGLSKDFAHIAPLPREFKKPSACFYRDRLYVIEEQPILVYEDRAWKEVRCRNFPKNIGFNCAVPYHDCIYLTSTTGYSLYKFDPEAATISLVGKFQEETQNICIVGDVIYNFYSEQFDYRSTVETYDIKADEFKQIWEKRTEDFEFAPYGSSGCFPVVLFPNLEEPSEKEAGQK